MAPAVRAPADLADRDLADRVAPVIRADRAVGMAATGREATIPVVPADTSRVDLEDTDPGARVVLQDRGSLGDRAVQASLVGPVGLVGTIPADPAVTILLAQGRMVQVLRVQGLRGRAAQVLSPVRALLDLTLMVRDRAHLDRKPAVPDRMPAHLDPTRPADRTPREVATRLAGATHPAEVTDLRL